MGLAIHRLYMKHHPQAKVCVSLHLRVDLQDWYECLTDTNGSQLMNPTDAGDPLSDPPVPRGGGQFCFLEKCLNNN